MAKYGQMSEKKFYQTKEFLKLQKKWYKKAADSGFQDAETIDNHGEPYWGLTSSAGCYSSTLDAARSYDASQERYYELAREHSWKLRRKWSIDKDLREAFFLYAQHGISMTGLARVFGIGTERLRRFIREQEAVFLP